MLEMLKEFFILLVAPVVAIVKELFVVPATALYDTLIECIAMNDLSIVNIWGMFIVLAIVGAVLCVIFGAMIYSVSMLIFLVKEEKRQEKREWKRNERAKLLTQLQEEAEFDEMYEKYVGADSEECEIIEFPF